MFRPTRQQGSQCRNDMHRGCWAQFKEASKARALSCPNCRERIGMLTNCVMGFLNNTAKLQRKANNSKKKRRERSPKARSLVPRPSQEHPYDGVPERVWYSLKANCLNNSLRNLHLADRDHVIFKLDNHVWNSFRLRFFVNMDIAGDVIVIIQRQN